MRTAANDPSNPDATPLLDGWGWDDYWSADEWLMWHGAMKSRYGLASANARFLEWWRKQGMFSAPLNARTFSTQFREYARENGFYEWLYPDGAAIMRPLGTAINDVPVAVDGAIQNAGTALRVAGYAVPVVLVGVAVWYFWPVIARTLAKRPA